MNTRTFRLLLAVVSAALWVGTAQAQAPAASPAPAGSASPTPNVSSPPGTSTAPSPATSAGPAPAAGASPAPEAGANPPPSASPTPPPAAAQAPATSPAQTTDAFGEETTLEAKKVVVVKGNANWDNAFDTLIDSFKALSTLLDKQGIKPAGNGMIVYTSTDDTGFTFMAEIPIDQEPKNLGKGMSIGQSPDGKALKFVHRGSYDNMDNTYEAITNHLDERKLEAKDTFIEEYLTDPLKTAEDKLIINVYVPLK
jgi:effector-binding domain-containing protein